MAKNNKGNLSTTPEYAKVESDGRDIEFYQELADENDLEAQARAEAADERDKRR